MSNEALRVDLVAAARDEASASLAKTNAELRELHKNVKGAAKEAAATGDSVTALGERSRSAAAATSTAWEKVEGLDEVKSGFEKVRGVIEFIPAVAALAAGAVAVLSEVFDDGQQRLEQYKREAEGTRDVLSALEKRADSSAKAVEDLTLKLAQLSGNKELAEQLQYQQERLDAERKIGALVGDQVAAQIALNSAVKDTSVFQAEIFRLDAQIVARRADGVAHQRSERDIAESVRLLEQRRSDVMFELHRAQQSILDASLLYEDSLKRQEALARSVAQAIADAARRPVLEALDEYSKGKEKADKKPPKPKPAGGGPKVDTEAQAIRELQLAYSGAVGSLERAEVAYTQKRDELAKARISGREREVREELALLELQAAQEDAAAKHQKELDAAEKKRLEEKKAYRNEYAAVLEAEQRAQQETIQETWRLFNEGIESVDALNPKLHDYASALAGIGREASSLVSAHKLTKEGILGLIGASAKATTALISDTQDRALVEALLYAGLGAAYIALGDYPQGIALEGAAALLFIAAATGGGGKKGTGATSSTSTGGGGSGGGEQASSITNVWNISGGAGDLGSIANLNRRAEYAQRNTGFDQRSPGW